ncbi:MAG: SIMPL domain-containing protein [Nitrososphaeraceae archaeon]|nr:SIMPL domain-containing protein [Nitrososphaeraceae archaeon]
MTKQNSIKMSIIAITTTFTLYLLIHSYNVNEHNLYAQSSTPDNKTLFVTGSATTETKPDKVTVSLGVETTNTKAKAALAANSELMNKIINALKTAGVKENETSTASFTITPNRNYSIDKNQGKLIGFTVSNSIQIDSSNVNDTSDWIDIAVSSGANNVNSIYFSLSDKKLDEIKKELLIDAIENAKEKADIAASALGHKIVGIRTASIDQVTPFFPGPLPYATESLKNEALAPSTPILTGEQQISLNVDIVFLMEK